MRKKLNNREGRKKRRGGFLTKAASTFITLGTGAILNFFINVVMARILGPTGKGIITPALSAATIAIALATLGLDNSTAFFLDTKRARPRDILLTSLSFGLFSGVLALLGVRFVLEFLIPEATPAARTFFAIGVFFTVIYTITQSVLLSRNRITLINLIKLAGDIVRTILATIFLYKLWPSVEGFAFAYMLAQAINSILATSFAFTETGIKGASINSGFLGKAIGFGIAAFLATLTIQLNRQVGVLILKATKSVTETGIYSQAQTFSALLLLIPQALSFALYGAVVGEKGKEKFTARVVRLSLFFILIASVAIGLIAPWLIPFLFTAKFTSSIPYLWGLLPAVVIYTLPLLYSSLLMASWGKPWLVFISSIIGLTLNCGINVVFVSRFASWATVAAFNISALAMAVFYTVILIKQGGLSLSDILIPKKKDFQLLFKRKVI